MMSTARFLLSLNDIDSDRLSGCSESLLSRFSRLSGPHLNVLCIGSRRMEAGEGAVGAARPEIANFFDGPADFLADDTRAQHRAGPY